MKTVLVFYFVDSFDIDIDANHLQTQRTWLLQFRNLDMISIFDENLSSHKVVKKLMRTNFYSYLK